MYTHVLILWIKGYQLFRNYMWDMNHHNPFGSVLISFNKVIRIIVFKLYNIIFSYIDGDMISCV